MYSSKSVAFAIKVTSGYCVDMIIDEPGFYFEDGMEQPAFFNKEDYLDPDYVEEVPEEIMEEEVSNDPGQQQIGWVPIDKEDEDDMYHALAGIDACRARF